MSDLAEVSSVETPDNPPPSESDRALFKGVKPRNNVDYMLRNTQQHHVQLSLMADQKANILLGSAIFIVTVALGQMQIVGYSNALASLCIFMLISAILAIKVLTPSIKPISPQSKDFNPLFFSHFSTVSADDYMEHMDEILHDDARVYQTVVRDIHQLGSVLYKRKYRLLSFGYRLFIMGLVTCFIFFIIERS